MHFAAPAALTKKEKSLAPRRSAAISTLVEQLQVIAFAHTSANVEFSKHAVTHFFPPTPPGRKRGALPAPARARGRSGRVGGGGGNARLGGVEAKSSAEQRVPRGGDSHATRPNPRRDRLKEAETALCRGVETAEVLNPSGLPPAPGVAVLYANRAAVRIQMRLYHEAMADADAALRAVPEFVKAQKLREEAAVGLKLMLRDHREFGGRSDLFKGNYKPRGEPE